MARPHDALNLWVSAHAALLVEGQTRLSELIGTSVPEWELSLTSGLIDLAGHRLQFALLGSVDEEENAWLWAWADPGLDQRALAIRRAAPLRGFGANYGLWEFAEPRVSMTGVLDLGLTAGASLALVAMPQLLGGAVFSGPYPGGRLYVVITDPQLTAEEPTAVTAARYLSGAKSYGVALQRDLVGVYAAAHQLSQETEATTTTLTFTDHSQLAIDFDADGCIARIRGILPPSARRGITDDDAATAPEAGFGPMAPVSFPA